MDEKVIFIGFFLGFFGSVPLAGPIAILVFNRSLKSQFQAAFAIASGAAVAEAIYAALALKGMVILTQKFPAIYTAGIVAGALTFIILGVIFWRIKPELNSELIIVNKKIKRNYLLGFSITALNPTFLVSWSSVVLFILSYTTLKTDMFNISLFGVGVFFGVVGWFGLAITLIKKYKKMISMNLIVKIYKACSFLLFFLAIQYLLKIKF